MQSHVMMANRVPGKNGSYALATMRGLRGHHQLKLETFFSFLSTTVVSDSKSFSLFVSAMKRYRTPGYNIRAIIPKAINPFTEESVTLGAAIHPKRNCKQCTVHSGVAIALTGNDKKRSHSLSRE